MSRQRGIFDREPAQKYSREELIASYDFCIAALEEEAAGFRRAIAIMKEHRAKLFQAEPRKEAAHQSAGGGGPCTII